MLFFSHRGNISGPNPELENTPDYVLKALNKGFSVVVDVCLKNEVLYLGNKHSDSKTEVDKSFLQNTSIVCRAHDEITYEALLSYEIHCFYHDNHQDPKTSLGLQMINYELSNEVNLSQKTILMFPEEYLSNKPNYNTYKQAFGILSNYIINYRRCVEAKHHVAMIISGRIRCYDRLFIPKIKAFYEANPDHYIHIFASLNYPSLNDDIINFNRSCCLSGVNVTPYKCDQKYIDYPKVRLEYTTQRHILGNYMSHSYNNNVAFRLIEEYSRAKNDIIFKTVTLYRTDITSESFPKIVTTNEIEPDTLYHPQPYEPEWIQNNTVTGSYALMKYYCDFYHYIDTYLERDDIVFHPEISITHHMNKHQNIKYNIYDDRQDIDINRHSYETR